MCVLYMVAYGFVMRCAIQFFKTTIFYASEQKPFLFASWIE